MKRFSLLCSLGSLALCGATGVQCAADFYGIGSTATTFTTVLSGDAERPDPVVSAGTGTGTFTLNADETELTFDISASGLSGPVTGAHFHFSAGGAEDSGPIIFDITDTVEEADDVVTAQGTWPVTAQDVTNLRVAYIYVNLHTDQNPAGEIRGNLTPMP